MDGLKISLSRFNRLLCYPDTKNKRTKYTRM